MRVLYLHQYFSIPQKSGGTRSYEMARRLVNDGYDVLIVTTTSNLGDDWAPSLNWHHHNLEGMKVDVLKVPYNNRMSYLDRIKAFIRYALNSCWHVRKYKYDVIYATSTPLTIIIPALAAKIWHRVPLVFEVRDLWPELPIAIGALRNPVAIALAHLLEWTAYHASEHIVVLSPGMGDGVKKRGVDTSKITVIPNGCDISMFAVPKENGNWVRQRLGLSTEQPLIVYTGTFGHINGVDYLVELAAQMCDIAPEVRFLLVGDGIDFEMVTEKARRLGVLDKNLWVWSPLPKHQIPEVLAAATVATSVFKPIEAMWNNSANKFFDALAAAKPIAINYGGWQADILTRSGAGIVLSPMNIKEAAAALADFVRDPKQVHCASAAARGLAISTFSRDFLYSQLKKVLEDVVQA